MAGHQHGNNNDPGAALRHFSRLSGAIVAPVAVYLLLWQAGVSLFRPALSPEQFGTVANILTVVIPCLGVLSSVVIAGHRAGRAIGGVAMTLFFLYFYLSSRVALEVLPPLLTFVGVGLALLMAGRLPTMTPDLRDAFDI